MPAIYRTMPSVIKAMDYIKTFRPGFVFSVNGIIRSMPSAPSSAVVQLAINELVKSGHATRQRKRVKNCYVYTKIVPVAKPASDQNTTTRPVGIKAKARSIATKAYENRIVKKNTVQRPTVTMPEAKKRIGVLQRIQAIEEALGL